MNHNPILIIYSNMGGNQLCSMSSMRSLDYGDAPAVVRSDLHHIVRQLNLNPNESLIKLLVSLDRSYTAWIHNRHMPELEQTALGKYLANISFELAQNIGWKPGERITSPIVLDRISEKTAGIR